MAMTGPTSKVLDSLGHGSLLQEVTMDTIKWRFFSLGLQAGIALQMLAVSVLMVTSSSNAVLELSSLYYPLFRGLFLVGFFASMYGMLLFAWKRTGIDYAAILGVPTEHNYHSIIRAGFTLVSLNFACFVLYFLTISVGLTSSKDVWPAAACLLFISYIASPASWMPEWNDAAQRAGLARTVGCVLIAPISATTFTHSFVADVFTSMPKCFSDLFYTVCIYTTGEAPWGTGRWEKKELAFSRGLTICTESNPPYRTIRLLLSALPFWIRLMQCARAYYDGRCSDRRHLFNGLKYCCSISVVIQSQLGDGSRSTSWVALSTISTIYAFFWDILIDWGLGPAWWRVRVHGEVPTYSPPSSRDTSVPSMRRIPSAAQLNVAAQLERNRRRMARQSYEEYSGSPSRDAGPRSFDVGPGSSHGDRLSYAPDSLHPAPAAATSGNWLLRPVRVFPDSIYFGAIGLNCLARLSWAIYISPGQQIVAQNTTLLLGAVELYRRAQWALLRVEWEQISRSWRAAKESEVCAGRQAESIERMPSADGTLRDALLTNP